MLAPGWTDYRERIEYAAHDVTALLRAGENVLGAILGDGWYAGFVGFDRAPAGQPLRRATRSCCASCTSSTRTAAREVVATDERWQATTGPLVYSDLLMGERYDARRELGPVASGGAVRDARRRAGSCPSARSRSA